MDWNRENRSVYEDMIDQTKYSIDAEYKDGANATKEIRKDIPDVIIINYSNLTSHSRRAAKFLKEYPKTKNIPMIFVDGSDEDIEKLKMMEIDYILTTKSELLSLLEKY